MADVTLDLGRGLGFGFGAIDRCPACASGRLLAVDDGELTYFLCEDCDQCWHLSMGWAQPVDPELCAGGARPGRGDSDVIDVPSDPTGSV